MIPDLSQLGKAPVISRLPPVAAGRVLETGAWSTITVDERGLVLLAPACVEVIAARVVEKQFEEIDAVEAVALRVVELLRADHPDAVE